MPFPGLIGRAFYHALLLPYFSLFTLGWSTRVSGQQNLPSAGPMLLLANHQSFLDPMLLGIAAYPRPLTFLARKQLFARRWFGAFIRWCGAIPIDQSFGRDGLRLIMNRLKQGESVVVFPEGARTTTGQIMPLKPGITLLLRHAEWPIVPTGIAGAFAAWPRGRLLPRLSPLFLPASERCLAVHFAEPIDPAEARRWNRDWALAQLTIRIQQAAIRAAFVRRQSSSRRTRHHLNPMLQTRIEPLEDEESRQHA